MATNNQTPHNGKHSSTGPRPGAGCESVALLDAFAQLMSTTVREAVFDWLEAHKAEVLEAFRGIGEFEAAKRPLPYHRFSLRLSKGLRSIGATIFRDVVAIGKKELLKIKGLGTTCVGELEAILREYGVPTDAWDYSL